MSTVVTFGEALIDFRADSNNADGAQTFIRQAGGAPANVAVAIAQLGSKAAFVGMLAQDMFGDFLLSSLNDYGVDTQFIRFTDKAPTALAFVSLDKDGERTFSFRRPPAADLLFRSTDFDQQCFKDCGIFHVCSVSMTDHNIAGVTREGMQTAQQLGALVSFDINLRLNLWPKNVDPKPVIWEALKLADIVKLARNELEYLAADFENGDQYVIEKLLKQGVKLVIVTDGPSPLYYYTQSQRGVLSPFSCQAVDTTAAGDAFIAGVLYAISQALYQIGVNKKSFIDLIDSQLMLEKILRFGAAVGALAVTKIGAIAAMPALEAVERLLNDQ